MAKTRKVFSISDLGISYDCVKVAHDLDPYRVYRISYDIGSDGMYHKHRNLVMKSDSLPDCISRIYDIFYLASAGYTSHIC